MNGRLVSSVPKKPRSRVNAARVRTRRGGAWRGVAEWVAGRVRPQEELLEPTIEELSKEKDGGGVIDLQRILELKGLKKADTERLKQQKEYATAP